MEDQARGTPQVSRSRLAAVLAREPIPSEPIGDPSIHHHSGRIGRDRPVHVTTGGTSRMVITATAMAVTAAVVFAGSLLLSGPVERPTTPPIGASPAPATESPAPATESPSPLVGTETVTDDVFELTIATPRTTWSADEPIEVGATLTYIGDQPEMTVIGAGSGIVGFGIEQLDGPVDMDPGWRLSAREYDFAQGDRIEVPFTKSGGFDPDGPMGDFWRAWFDDPELRLPAGSYRLFAVARYDLPALTPGVEVETGVELRIEIVDDASSLPTITPNESPDQGGLVELGGTWRPMTPGPFGAVGVPGGWTGSELIVVDPDQERRAAAYDPDNDTWRAIAQPPWRVGAYSRAYWTGSELIFVERRGADGRGLAVYDPAADSWRTTAPAPRGSIDGSVWADGVIVVASGSDLATASYDPATDAWTELPPIPIEADPLAMPGMEQAVALYWTGEEVFALTSPHTDPEGTFTVTPLDLTTDTWGEPSIGPLSFLAGVPVWTGEEFVFASYLSSDVRWGPRDGRYDPATGTWTVTAHACDLDTSAAVWTGSLILDVPVGRAYDPASGQCYTLPAPPRPERSRPLRIWTGTELLAYSGNTGEESRAKRDGIAYQPPAEDGRMPDDVASDRVTDWGPLTVISEGGAPDAGLGPGTLSIGPDCVTFHGDRSRDDVGVTLVWPSDQTSWLPADRQIVFEHSSNDTLRLSDGEHVIFGGQGLGGDTPEVAEQVAAWLEGVWVQRPGSSCPAGLWHVGEVLMVPRVELVNPKGRIRGERAVVRAERVLATRADYAGLYLDNERDGLPVYLFTGDLDSAIEQLRESLGAVAAFEVREVERSSSELATIRQAITDATEELRRQGIDIVEIGTDVRRNEVFVGVLGKVDLASALLSDHADARAFRVEKVGRPETA